jgi:hypothetical protein
MYARSSGLLSAAAITSIFASALTLNKCSSVNLSTLARTAKEASLVNGKQRSTRKYLPAITHHARAA